MIPPYNFMDSSRAGIFGKLIIRYVCVNGKKNLRKQIIFLSQGDGGVRRPRRRDFFAPRARDRGRADAARGRRRLCRRECTPHSLFGLAKKRTGRARSKRKKRFRGERVFWVLGKSLPAAWCGRGFGFPGHPLLLFPLALQCSVSGARRTGFPMTTSDDRRSVNAGKTDSRDENGARR